MKLVWLVNACVSPVLNGAQFVVLTNSYFLNQSKTFYIFFWLVFHSQGLQNMNNEMETSSIMPTDIIYAISSEILQV